MGKTVRRELGATEGNWVLGVDGGTGITVSAFLFGHSLSKATVQAAVIKLVSRRPFLRSQIVYVGQKLFFELSEKTVLVEELPNPFVGEGRNGKEEKEEEAKEMWLKIVDLEMNILFPKTRPTSVFEVHLYNRGLPGGSSLVVLRSHSASGDMLCSGVIGSEFLNSLKEAVQKGKSGEGGSAGLEAELREKATLDNGGVGEDFAYDKALEKSVPKGANKKPLWAHGKDIIGYGLGSLRQAYLPFRNTEQQRKSQLIRASLSKDATDNLLKMCKTNSSDLYGALSAAALKSVAAYKKVGNKGELYHNIILYNCRSALDPQLPEDALGFYHSALPKIFDTAEKDEYWKVAGGCSKELQDAIKNKTHFTDMGDLNMLMVQAINHPNLTPSSTLRTAMFSVLYEPIIETTNREVTEVLHLKDFVSASSIHGVGPCFSIFHSLRDGALHLSFVYCSPLFARRDIQTLVDSIVRYITV
ncbi:unnamed protein product [Calypogeia fissa]